MNVDKEIEWEAGQGRKWWNTGIRELWLYRDLLGRLVRKELLVNYQQTLLGPFWVIVQPLLTTIIYYLIFSKVVKVSTDGIPPLLFYLSGIILWNLFSDCLSDTMNTFTQHGVLFSKVYFPRLVVPLSVIITHTFRNIIQLLVFLVVYLYYFYFFDFSPGWKVIFFPLIIIATSLFGLAMGLLISVATFRYRDLSYALQFILRLYMFATPIVYPAAIVPPNLARLFWLNPLTVLMETFRSVFFDSTTVGAGNIAYCALVIFILLIAGLLLFRKNESKAIDIV